MKISDVDRTSIWFSIIEESFDSTVNPETGEKLPAVNVFLQATTPAGDKFRQWVGVQHWQCINNRKTGELEVHAYPTSVEDLRQRGFYRLDQMVMAGGRIDDSAWHHMG